MGLKQEAGWTQRLALVATSFRRVGLGRLGDFVIDPEAHDELRDLRRALGAEELVYLATCNRVECYLVLPQPVSRRDEAELGLRAVRFFQARGATADADSFLVRTRRGVADHLFAVASSLDSLVLGETQISGQARRAADRALELGLAGPWLRRLFDAAVGCSRRVRGATTLGTTPVSAASIAVQKVKKYFGDAGPGVAVLVGAGEMTCKVAQALQGKPSQLVFVNRTVEKAQALADRFGGRAVSLEEFLARPPEQVDLLFAATSATEPVVPARALAPALAARRAAGRRDPLVVCDLGLPRDVDPALDGERGVLVVDMERIRAISEANQGSLAAEVERAREVVAEEVARVLREDRFRSIAGQSAEAMLASQLAHLEPSDREAILRFATGLAVRFARQPQHVG